MGEKDSENRRGGGSLIVVFISFISLIMGFLDILFYPLTGPPDVSAARLWWGLALVLAIGSLVMKDNRRKMGGRIFAIIVILIAVFLITVSIIYPPTVPRLSDEMLCGSNMAGLGKAMLLYAQDYDEQYPTPERWCDLLIEGILVNYDQFICRGNEQQPSSYAMNPNCQPSSPADMVLLFETKGGWNQFGGAELLTAENHKGKGANILFNDCHVKFVKPEDFNSLKWKADANE